MATPNQCTATDSASTGHTLYFLRHHPVTLPKGPVP
nr:MAG TPA: hypothetical protein [Caudoviricetes sp.]